MLFLFFEHFTNNSKTITKSVTSEHFSKRYSQSYPQALWKTQLLDNKQTTAISTTEQWGNPIWCSPLTKSVFLVYHRARFPESSAGDTPATYGSPLQRIDRKS